MEILFVFLRNSICISTLLHRTTIRKVGMYFPTIPKLAPNFTSCPHLRVENMSKLVKNSVKKTVLWSFSYWQYTAAQLFVNMFKRQMWKAFWKTCWLYVSVCVFYNDLSAPSDWRQCTYFQTIASICMCDETIGKAIARLKLWHNFLHEGQKFVSIGFLS